MAESGNRSSAGFHTWIGTVAGIFTIVSGVTILLYGDHLLGSRATADPAPTPAPAGSTPDAQETMRADPATHPTPQPLPRPAAPDPDPGRAVPQQPEAQSVEADPPVETRREASPPAKKLGPVVGIIGILCERKSLTFSFRTSDYDTHQLRYLGGDHVVEIGDCDERTGRFTTITELAGRAPRTGRGFATDRRLSFEFNTFETTGGGNLLINCTVGAGDIESREVVGTIRCTGRKSAEWPATIAF